MQTPEEIDRYTVDEALNDVDRALHLLKKGQAQQRLSTLHALATQVFGERRRNDSAQQLENILHPAAALAAHTDAAHLNAVASSQSFAACSAALDRLLPSLTPILLAPDGQLDERQAALQTLVDTIRSGALSAVVVSTKILPLFTKLLAKEPNDSLLSDAVGGVSAILESGLCTKEAVVQDLLACAMALGGVSNSPHQRVASCRLLASVLVHKPIPQNDAISKFFEPLMSLCQDTEASVRCCMAGLLSDLLLSTASSSSAGGGAGTSVRTMSVTGSLPQALPPHITTLRERCFEELTELLGDEDIGVKCAAIESGILTCCRADAPRLASDATSTDILRRLRRMWEGVTTTHQHDGAAQGVSSLVGRQQSSLVSGGAGGDKAELLRWAFARRAGELVSSSVAIEAEAAGDGRSSSLASAAELDLGGRKPRRPSLPAGSDVASPAPRRGSINAPSPTPPGSASDSGASTPLQPAAGGAIPGALASPQPPGLFTSARQRRMSRRFSAKQFDPAALAAVAAASGSAAPSAMHDDAAHGASLHTSSLESVVAFYTSIGTHRNEEMRLQCAQALPGCLLSFLAGMGPLAPPAPPPSQPGFDGAFAAGTGARGAAAAVANRASTASSSSAGLAAFGKAGGAVPARKAGSAANNESGSSNTVIDPGLAASVGYARDDDVIGDVLFLPLQHLATAAGAASSAGGVAKGQMSIVCAFHLRQSLLPLLYRLAGDPSPVVRRTVAGALHHVAAAMGHSRSVRLLTPLIYSLLQDSDDAPVVELVETAHVWLPCVCASDAVLRMQTFSLLVPVLFTAACRPAIAQSWRAQLHLLSALRLLALVYPAPQAMEAALTIAHKHVMTGSKPVRSAAVHTMVWFARHGPTGRIRCMARDYSTGRLCSVKSMKEQTTSMLAGMQVGISPLAADASTSASAAGSGTPLAESLQRIVSHVVAQQSQVPPLVTLSGSLQLPLDFTVDALFKLKLSPSASSPPNNSSNSASSASLASAVSLGYSTSTPGLLTGPAWKRECAIDACAAALWLFSRSIVKSHYLPPVIDMAKCDPVSSVRLAAVQALPGIRPWFVLPADAQVVSLIVATLSHAASKDTCNRVAQAASAGLALLRRMDAAALAVIPPGAPSHLLLAFPPAADPARSPAQQLHDAPAGAISPMASGTASRRRSSISGLAGSTGIKTMTSVADNAPTPGSAFSSPVHGGARSLASPPSSADMSGLVMMASPATATSSSSSSLPQSLSPDIVDLAAAAVAIEYAKHTKAGRDTLVAVNLLQAAAAVSTGVPVPVGGGASGGGTASDGTGAAGVARRSPVAYSTAMAATMVTIDGADALSAASAFCRNPFRLGVARALPELPAACAVTGSSNATRASPDDAGAAAGSSSSSSGGTPSSSGGVSAGRGLLPMDDIVGLQTGVHSGAKAASTLLGRVPEAGLAFRYACSRTSVAIPQPWSPAPVEFLAPTAPREGPSQLTAGTSATDAAGGSAVVPAAEAASWRLAPIAKPYSVPRQVVHYHPLQLVSPCPHSAAEENNRLAVEAMLAAAARAEDDGDRRRAMEERRLEAKAAKAGLPGLPPTGAAAASGGGVIPNAGAASMPTLGSGGGPDGQQGFNPCGWPTAIAPAVAAIALGVVPVNSPFTSPAPEIGVGAGVLQCQLPHPLPMPHSVVVQAAGVAIGCNGPTATGGVTATSITAAGNAFGQSSSTSSILAGSSTPLSTPTAAGSNGGSTSRLKSVRGITALAGGGGGATQLSFHQVMATQLLSPALLSTLLQALCAYLQANPTAIPTSITNGSSGGALSPTSGGVLTPEKAGQGQQQQATAAAAITPQRGAAAGKASTGGLGDSLTALATQLAQQASAQTAGGRGHATAGAGTGRSVASEHGNAAAGPSILLMGAGAASVAAAAGPTGGRRTISALAHGAQQQLGGGGGGVSIQIGSASVNAIGGGGGAAVSTGTGDSSGRDGANEDALGKLLKRSTAPGRPSSSDVPDDTVAATLANGNQSSRSSVGGGHGGTAASLAAAAAASGLPASGARRPPASLLLFSGGIGASTGSVDKVPSFTPLSSPAAASTPAAQMRLATRAGGGSSIGAGALQLGGGVSKPGSGLVASSTPSISPVISAAAVASRAAGLGVGSGAASAGKVGGSGVAVTGGRSPVSTTGVASGAQRPGINMSALVGPARASPTTLLSDASGIGSTTVAASSGAVVGHASPAAGSANPSPGMQPQGKPTHGPGSAHVAASQVVRS